MHLRIRRSGRKFLFVVTFFVIAYLAAAAARALDLPPYAIDEVIALLVVTAVYIGTRSFRGEGEDIRAPRIWWRMSAKPTASFALAMYFFCRSVLSMWAVYDVVVSGWMDFTYILLCVVDPIIAGLYLNSGIRLGRAKAAFIESSAQAE